MSKSLRTNLFLAAVTIAILFTMVHFAIAGIEHAFEPFNQLHHK